MMKRGKEPAVFQGGTRGGNETRNESGRNRREDGRL